MAASSETPRFDIISDDDLEDFIESTDSENTKKLIQYGLSIFKDYCSFIQVNYEELDNTELDKLLCRLVPGPKKEPTTRPSPCTASDLHCIDIL